MINTKPIVGFNEISAECRKAKMTILPKSIQKKRTKNIFNENNKRGKWVSKEKKWYFQIFKTLSKSITIRLIL